MKTIKGSYVGNRKDTTEALDFFERGFIKAPFKTIGMSELQKVYDLMRRAPFPVRLLGNLLILFQMRAKLPDDTWWIPANRHASSSFHVVNCVVAREACSIRRFILWPGMALSAVKDIKNDKPDQILIKCFHDYATMKNSPAFISHSSMKGFEDSTVGDTVLHEVSSHYRMVET